LSFLRSAGFIIDTNDEPPEHELAFVVDVNVTSKVRFAPVHTIANFSMAEGLLGSEIRVAVCTIDRARPVIFQISIHENQ